MVDELGSGSRKIIDLVVIVPKVDDALSMKWPIFFFLCTDSDRKRLRYRRGVRTGRGETDCQACCRRRGKGKENAAAVDDNFSAKDVS